MFLETELDKWVANHKLRTTVLGYLVHIAMKLVFQIRVLRAEKLAKEGPITDHK